MNESARPWMLVARMKWNLLRALCPNPNHTSIDTCNISMLYDLPRLYQNKAGEVWTKKPSIYYLWVLCVFKMCCSLVSPKIGHSQQSISPFRHPEF